MATLPTTGLPFWKGERSLICDDEDEQYLSAFRWKLLFKHRKSAEPNPRLLQVRCVRQSYYFYPHHLVAALHGPNADLVKSLCLISEFKTNKELYDLLLPFHLNRQIIPINRLDVRKVNLGLDYAYVPETIQLVVPEPLDVPPPVDLDSALKDIFKLGENT